MISGPDNPGKIPVHFFVTERKSCIMIIVPIKENENIDRVLKKMKRKFEKTGVLRELRDRQKFTKPSVKKREQKLKAIYIQKLRDQQDA